MSSRHPPAAALLLALAGCAAPEVPSAPPPRVAAPAPRPTPPPVAAASSDWRDWPLTPGTWAYWPGQSGVSAAAFGAEPGGTYLGAALVTITCDARARRITLSVASPPDAQPITIRTSSVARTLATGTTAHADLVVPVTRDARLDANDPLLDAMGFSRGRFVVEQPGWGPYVLPAWPEILRVAEDCRG